MTQSNTGLVIGEGFQNWINDHQATPESNEMYWNEEMRCMIARISKDGQDVRVLLIYNTMTNLVHPFEEAVSL